ncbi:unnamed protein product [Choristocarpus tenellus]
MVIGTWTGEGIEGYVTLNACQVPSRRTIRATAAI